MTMVTSGALLLAVLVVLGVGFSVWSAVVALIGAGSGALGRAPDWEWHVIVPWAGGARDDLDRAVGELGAAFPDAYVWVVDGAATPPEEDTRTALREAGRVRRVAAEGWPRERRGLVRALDAAYRSIDRAVGPGVDRDTVLVAVVAPDGSPVVSDGLAGVVTGRRLLGDPRVGAVQVGARIIGGSSARRREPTGAGRRWHRLVARLQDLESRGPFAASQLSRRASGTALLGGTGQVVRLSALDGVAGPDAAPWTGPPGGPVERGRSGKRQTPTCEDLTVRLWLSGRSTSYAPGGWVSRAAPPGLLGYLDQRTAWNLETARAASPQRIRHGRDLGRAVLGAWLRLLAGPAACVVILGVLAGGGFWLAGGSGGGLAGFLTGGGWAVIPVFLGLAFGEFWVWGVAYGRWIEPELGAWRGLVHGIAYPVLAVPALVAAWRALGRWALERREPRRGDRTRRETSRKEAGGREAGGREAGRQETGHKETGRREASHGRFLQRETAHRGGPAPAPAARSGGPKHAVGR